MPTPPIATSTIVSQAFRFMEASPISSFAEDSDEARLAAETYPVALRTCLEFTDWAFASTFRSLPQAVLPVTGGDDPDMPYFFNLPDGIIRIQELKDGYGAVAWRRDAEGIRSDTSGPLKIRYTRMITNEVQLPANFQTAVALHMASLLGPRFGLTGAKLDRIEAMARDRLAAASAQDATQASSTRYDDQPDMGDWATEATR
jgi:hypothetical protein